MRFWNSTRGEVTSAELSVVCFPCLITGMLLHRCYFTDPNVAAVQSALPLSFSEQIQAGSAVPMHLALTSPSG